MTVKILYVTFKPSMVYGIQTTDQKNRTVEAKTRMKMKVRGYKGNVPKDSDQRGNWN